MKVNMFRSHFGHLLIGLSNVFDCFWAELTPRGWSTALDSGQTTNNPSELAIVFAKTDESEEDEPCEISDVFVLRFHKSLLYKSTSESNSTIFYRHKSPWLWSCDFLKGDFVVQIEDEKVWERVSENVISSTDAMTMRKAMSVVEGLYGQGKDFLFIERQSLE